MSAILTVTAVAINPTNTLTIPAHGLATGAGAGALYTPNGTIPAGLAALTDYYAIVIDANTIKLASSSANAFANIPVVITSVGSGTLYLVLGIPYRRSTTYVAGSQLKSADLDLLQDTWIALWAYLTGQPQSVFFGALLPGTPGQFGDGTDGALVFDGIATVLGLVPGGSVYTMTRDISATNVTINNGVTIITNGFVLGCIGTLTNNGTISWNGSNGAAGGTGNVAGGVGGALLAAGSIGGSGAGSNGGAVTAGAGQNAIVNGNVTAYPGMANSPGALGIGGAGGNANAGGLGTNGGGQGQTASKGASRLEQAQAGRLSDGTVFQGGAGGGGGGGGNQGTGASGGSGGGGGAGGGVIIILARAIAGTGTITANGGNGGNGGNSAGNGSNNGAGGGGGAGGLLILVYATKAATVTTSVAGGAAGAGGNGGVGTLAATAATAGAAGLVVKYNLSGDGT